MKRFVFIASMWLIGAGSQADVLTLSDGTKVEGQVLSKDDSKVLIDTMISGVRVKMSYTRAEISEIETKELPADFFTPAKPAAKNPVDAKPRVEAPAAPTKKPESASPVESAGDGRVPYLEIMAQGTVGEDFDETGIHEVLEFATDVLDSFNRARRTTTLPDGIKELETLADEASKLANEKLKK